MPNPFSRFYIACMKSGNVLLVNIPRPMSEGRNSMWVFLSEDEGETWKYSMFLDERESCSYPDAD